MIQLLQEVIEMTILGDNLRKLRTSRGFSQDRFAREIGSNQVSVSAWEIGSRTPNMETVKHIAAVFHVPVTSLISVEESGHEDDFVREVSDVIRQNPKVRLLFDRAKYLSASDLDTVLSVVNAITRERIPND